VMTIHRNTLQGTFDHAPQTSIDQGLQAKFEEAF